MVAVSELRELDEEELEGRLAEYKRELLNLRFQLGTGQLDNVSRLPQVRKDVARVLTVLRDREIALVEGREPVRSSAEVLPRRTSRRARAKAEAEAVETAPDELEEEPIGDEEEPIGDEEGTDDEFDDDFDDEFDDGSEDESIDLDDLEDDEDAEDAASDDEVEGE